MSTKYFTFSFPNLTITRGSVGEGSDSSPDLPQSESNVIMLTAYLSISSRPCLEWCSAPHCSTRKPSSPWAPITLSSELIDLCCSCCQYFAVFISFCFSSSTFSLLLYTFQAFSNILCNEQASAPSSFCNFYFMSALDCPIKKCGLRKRHLFHFPYSNQYIFLPPP